MKVNYARDVFRPEFVAALRSMHDLKEPVFENVETLFSFIEFIWRLYNYHDVCNLTQHSLVERDIFEISNRQRVSTAKISY
jgi:hypothetical protein